MVSSASGIIDIEPVRLSNARNRLIYWSWIGAPQPTRIVQPVGKHSLVTDSAAPT